MKKLCLLLTIFMLSILIPFAGCKKESGIVSPDKITEKNAIDEADKLMKEIDKI